MNALVAIVESYNLSYRCVPVGCCVDMMIPLKYIDAFKRLYIQACMYINSPSFVVFMYTYYTLCYAICSVM